MARHEQGVVEGRCSRFRQPAKLELSVSQRVDAIYGALDLGEEGAFVDPDHGVGAGLSGGAVMFAFEHLHEEAGGFVYCERGELEEVVFGHTFRCRHVQKRSLFTSREQENELNSGIARALPLAEACSIESNIWRGLSCIIRGTESNDSRGWGNRARLSRPATPGNTWFRQLDGFVWWVKLGSQAMLGRPDVSAGRVG